MAAIETTYEDRYGTGFRRREPPYARLPEQGVPDTPLLAAMIRSKKASAIHP